MESKTDTKTGTETDTKTGTPSLDLNKTNGELPCNAYRVTNWAETQAHNAIFRTACTPTSSDKSAFLRSCGDNDWASCTRCRNNLDLLCAVDANGHPVVPTFVNLAKMPIQGVLVLHQGLPLCQELSGGFPHVHLKAPAVDQMYALALQVVCDNFWSVIKTFLEKLLLVDPIHQVDATLKAILQVVTDPSVDSTQTFAQSTAWMLDIVEHVISTGTNPKNPLEMAKLIFYAISKGYRGGAPKLPVYHQGNGNVLDMLKDAVKSQAPKAALIGLVRGRLVGYQVKTVDPTAGQLGAAASVLSKVYSQVMTLDNMPEEARRNYVPVGGFASTPRVSAFGQLSQRVQATKSGPFSAFAQAEAYATFMELKQIVRKSRRANLSSAPLSETYTFTVHDGPQDLLGCFGEHSWANTKGKGCGTSISGLLDMKYLHWRGGMTGSVLICTHKSISSRLSYLERRTFFPEDVSSGYHHVKQAYGRMKAPMVDAQGQLIHGAHYTYNKATNAFNTPWRLDIDGKSYTVTHYQ